MGSTGLGNMFNPRPPNETKAEQLSGLRSSEFDFKQWCCFLSLWQKTDGHVAIYPKRKPKEDAQFCVCIFFQTFYVAPSVWFWGVPSGLSISSHGCQVSGCRFGQPRPGAVAQSVRSWGPAVPACQWRDSRQTPPFSWFPGMRFFRFSGFPKKCVFFLAGHLRTARFSQFPFFGPSQVAVLLGTSCWGPGFDVKIHETSWKFYRKLGKHPST